MLDYDADGWPDLFIANDTQPNKLYRNKKDGTFEEVGMTAGCRVQRRRGRRAPGWASTPPTTTIRGRPSLVIGNFSNEMIGALRQSGKRPLHRRGALVGDRQGLAADADVRGLLLRRGSRRTAGHLRRQRSRGRRHQPRSAEGHLRRTGRISSETSAAAGSRRSRAAVGAALNQPVVARGAAYGDFDNDGDLDVLETTNNGPARLLQERWRQSQPHAAGEDGRHPVESRRHRRAGDDHPRQRAEALGHGEVGIELLLAERAARDLRPRVGGQGEGRRGRRGRVAASITSPASRAGQTIIVQEGKGLLSASPVRSVTP